MQLLLEDIEAIGAMVMESIAGVVLEPAACEIPSDQPALTGCVHIDGAWNGAALVQCELPLARRMTAVLFDRAERDVTLEDVRDALGELTNMVGGNVKALLPAPSRLSLPTVVEGADYAVTVPGTKPAGVVSFRTGGEILVIRILVAEKAPVVVGS